MSRLVWAGLRESWRLWAGAALLCLASAALLGCLAIVLASVLTGRAYLDGLGIGPVYDGLTETASMLSLFVVGPTVVVLAVVLGLVGQMTARQHAVWRLAGALPAQVRRAMLAQSVFVAALASVAGTSIALPFGQQVVDLIAQLPPPGRLDARIPAWALAAVVALEVVIAVVAAFVPAWRAPRPRRAMGVFRWTLLGAVSAFLVLPNVLPMAILYADTRAARGDEDATAEALGDLITINMGFGLSVIVLIAAAAPAVTPAVLRLWTGIVPASVAPLWHLARHSAGARLAVSTAATTPLVIAVAMLGLYFSSVHTLAAALGEGSLDEAYGQQTENLIVLGPPAALALIGSVIVLAMTSRGRERDLAVLRTQGTTSRDMSLIALAEALIYAVTAAIMATVPVAAVTALGAISLSAARYPLSYLHAAWGVPASAWLIGAVLMAGVVLAAGIPAIRRPAAETLALIEP
ncbi:MAG: hypothetical protein LBK95_03260 [Bifidobacteriaceae bacterium]|jgi:putative ABC transport system permease protein|nr:hypothetical protein [Bifidobacteriaceae bacterium]